VSDHGSAVQRSWDERVAGEGVPTWAELDEATKRRWRGSVTAAFYAFDDLVKALAAPLQDASRALTTRRR
jgi:hypothetical protein